MTALEYQYIMQLHYSRDFIMDKAYVIVMSYSIARLQDMVNEYIARGYVPHGAPQFVIERSVTNSDNVYAYMQAMVKKGVDNGTP